MYANEKTFIKKTYEVKHR